MKGGAVIVVVAGLWLGCGGPPRRPAGLPAAAQWVGKGDQGRFVVIGAREGTLWHLELYDRKGGKHPVTRWRLQGFARTSLEVQEIQGFDGEAILLNDEARLVPQP